jgi:hypothetical protein
LQKEIVAGANSFYVVVEFSNFMMIAGRFV